MKTVKEIEVPEWWCPGNGMIYRRDALPVEHPESTYSYIERLGYRPEDFGVFGKKICFNCNAVIRE